MSMTVIATGFACMLLLMFLSLPVAVSILSVGALGGYLAYGMPLVETMGGVVWGTLNNPVMTAIPLFMLLGELLLRGGIADKMFDALAVWLGRLPGGLLHTNIGTCALFSATSGSSVATAATVGTIALPALGERNYPVRPALGTLAAGGTLGILIPPSVNLLVYGSLANVSVGQLFIAGILPGLLLTVLFSAYVAFRYPDAGRASAQPEIDSAEKRRLLGHLVPPAIIFFIVMGSIYGGLATPTESAALGVIAAFFFVWRNGKLTWRLLEACFIQSARTTGMVVLVIVCALLLNVTLSMTGGTQAVTRWVADLGLSFTALMLLLVVFYVILGMFMDAMSMLVLTVPIAVPMITALGADPVWFGVFVVVMCEIALITPPVGMNLFVVQGIRKGGGDFNDVVKGALPFTLIMIAFAGLLIFVPGVALFLPGLGAQ
ncbi:TRAP transporter large permease [Histidinibacterium aquaticum]|uniref:TRAP transporter large permease protein n=1 Tax=Histidinibacterium aquaticum TaxID=2613962 RepID=A0A5J5GR92_9RHOB|nr:TRAP transporter large permease subunit [Histidinibacterium aquaticum]KAA9010024.1 TRAP transporter large permease subunit [Histidinibacterium aquaticum]